MFRLKPAEEFFADAVARQVGIIARVPLASGLLTGKLTRASTFAADDHRAFNREGQSFDKGETFSGVPYEAALDAVDALRPARAGWRDADAVCPSLDPDVGRREYRDSGRKDTGAGARELSRGGAPAALTPSHDDAQSAASTTSASGRSSMRVGK